MYYHICVGGDREAWSAAVPGVTKSWGHDLATEQLNNKYNSEKCYKINEIR